MSWFHSVLIDAPGVVALVWGSSFLVVKGINRLPWRQDQITEDTAKDAALKVLLAHIEERFEEWEQGLHYFAHQQSGVKIWTANEDYALHIEGKNWKLTKNEIPASWRTTILEATKVNLAPYRKMVEAFKPQTPLQIADAPR